MINDAYDDDDDDDDDSMSLTHGAVPHDHTLDGLHAAAAAEVWTGDTVQAYQESSLSYLIGETLLYRIILIIHT